jgi:hypothetical protein
LLTFLLKLYSLDQVALDPEQPAVEFSITLDGADLSRNISHVTAGIKINDPRAIDPISGIPIGMEDSRKLQSRELCYPCKVLIAKDSKTLYDNYYSDFFSFFKQVNEHGFGNFTAKENSNGILRAPFTISSPQDLSSLWKSTGRGGACKNKIDFCCQCACTSDVVHLPRQIRCERCVLTGREACYHWDVGDESTLSKAQERLLGMVTTAPYLGDATIQARLLLRLDNNQMDKLRDIQNICFLPENQQERNRFSREFLNHDLDILRLSKMGSIDVRRERVLAVLRSFDEANAMAKTIAIGNCAGAFITIRQAVPCILHMENRCDEKFIKMVFLEGFDSFTTDADRAKFIRAVELLVNTSILGTPTRPANWRLATARDKDSRQAIKDQTMPNTHCRKFLQNFSKLTAFCLPHDLPRQHQWNQTIERWNLVMEGVRSKEQYNQQAVDDFQDLADDWFEHYIELAGRDGCSNYTHLIASGHISFYLKEWGNLYRYSQQGWEAYNSLLKSVYYRRTQRGGYGGKRDEATSRVTPLARWMQRKLFFQSGDYLACENI